MQVDSAGPVDTHRRPVRLGHHPDGRRRHQGHRHGGSGVTKIEWEIPTTAALRHGQRAPAPCRVTVSRRRRPQAPHPLTDALGHVSQLEDAHDPASTRRCRSTRPRLRPPGSRSGSLDVTVSGTDAPAPASPRRVEDRQRARQPPSATPARRRSPATASTRSRPASSTSPATPRRGSRARPPGHHGAAQHAPRGRPGGWRKTPYCVLLNGYDADSGIAAVQWRVDGGAEHSRAPRASRPRRSAATASTRSRPASATSRATTSAWRVGHDPHRLGQADRHHRLPGAPVGNGHKITLTGTDALSGLGGQSSGSSTPARSRRPPQATIIGAGPHTLEDARAGQRRQLERLATDTVTVDPALPSEDTDAPLDTTSIPTNWRTGAVTRHRHGRRRRRHGRRLRRVAHRRPRDRAAARPARPSPSPTDGEHEIETRATDFAGNTSAWRSQTLKIDQTLPVDTTTLPAGWTNTPARVTLTATDATSGVDRDRVQDQRRHRGHTVASGVHLHAAGRRHAHDRPPHHRHRRPADGLEDRHRQGRHGPPDRHTSAAAPTAWQTTRALARHHRQRRGLRRRSRRVAPRTAATVADRHARGGRRRRHPDALHARRRQGRQRLGLALGDRAGRPHQAGQHDAAIARAWRKTNFTTTVSGTDATSGVQRIEWQARRRRRHRRGSAVRSPPTARTSSEPRDRRRRQRLRLARGHGRHRQDRSDAGRRLRPDGLAQRRAATCAVTADGGVSGLPTLTAARGGGAADDVAGGHYTVERRRPVDASPSAPSTAPATRATATADVKVDRTRARRGRHLRRRTPALTYICTRAPAPTRSPAWPALSCSVNGGAAVARRQRRLVHRRQGHRRRHRADAAGNAARSAPVTLADRTPPPPLRRHDAEEPSRRAPRARPCCCASRRLRLRAPARPALAVGDADRTTVDLRPLALGKGTFQFVIKVTFGKKTKTVTKTQTTSQGLLEAHQRPAPPPRRRQGQLTVRRKSGKRWVTHATGSAKLPDARGLTFARARLRQSAQASKGSAPCPQRPRVLVVANKTAATPALIEAVRERAARGPARFTLLVPNAAHGLHKLVDPEDQARHRGRARRSSSRCRCSRRPRAARSRA